MTHPAPTTRHAAHRRRPSARRLAGALAAGALVLGACSGSGESTATTASTAEASPSATATEAPTAAATTAPAPAGDVPEEIVERLRTVADTMAEQTSARISIRQEISGSAADQELSQEGEGVIDFTTGALRMTLESSALAGLGQGAGQVEIILLEDEVYLRVDAMGDQWVRMPASEQNIDDQLDPQSNFDHLAEALAAAEESGAEDVNGTATTRYDLVVDLSQQLEAASPEQRQSIEEQMETFDTTRLPMSVWVGEDDLIRRQQYEFTTDDPQTGQSVTMTQTLEYDEYGVEIDVTAPADAVDMSEMMGSPSEG